VYGAQQDSGAIMAPSRSDSGEISFRDWAPACAGGESGMIATDPQNPDILFGGTVTRCVQSLNQPKNVSPTLGLQGPSPAARGPNKTEEPPAAIPGWRQTWTLPLVFSPADKRTLYFSRQIMWKTTDGGNSWQQISGDLSRENPGVPPNIDELTAKDSALPGARKGVIYSIAPSPLNVNLIWAGTDDGLIHRTADGGQTWQNMTPPNVGPWSKVAMIEASHSEPNTAYAVVDRHRLEDYRPYTYRTRDAGKTWQLITAGLPADIYVNCIREDTVRRGLLFAGTELGAWVSFDDGDHWQSLQMNLPVTSVRDFAVQGDDLVVGTFGRSIWVLDSIAVLRQAAAQTPSEAAHLFTPSAATRLHPGTSDGTPLPKGTPVAENPPNGAIMDYWLKAPAQQVTLEIFDGANAAPQSLVRRYSSTDKPRVTDPRTLDIPADWVHPPQVLAATAGAHRFVWDLHYPPADEPQTGRGGGGGAFGAGANGQWVLPEHDYLVKLTVDGQSYTQKLHVAVDPRVKTPMQDFEAQFKLATSIAATQKQVADARREVTRLRQRLAAQLEHPERLGNARSNAEALDKQLNQLLGRPPVPPPGGFGGDEVDPASINALGRTLLQIMASVESADVAPTQRETAAYNEAASAAHATLAKWNEVKTRNVPALNTALTAAGLQPLQ